MLERLVRSVEERLAHLWGRAVLDDEPVADPLALRRAALAEHIAQRDAIRQALSDLKRHEIALTSTIAGHVRAGQVAVAYEQALELERVRQEFAAEKAKLPRLDQIIWSLEFDLKRQKPGKEA